MLAKKGDTLVDQGGNYYSMNAITSCDNGNYGASKNNFNVDIIPPDLLNTLSSWNNEYFQSTFPSNIFRPHPCHWGGRRKVYMTPMIPSTIEKKLPLAQMNLPIPMSIQYLGVVGGSLIFYCWGYHWFLINLSSDPPMKWVRPKNGGRASWLEIFIIEGWEGIE